MKEGRGYPLWDPNTSEERVIVSPNIYVIRDGVTEGYALFSSVDLFRVTVITAAAR